MKQVIGFVFVAAAVACAAFAKDIGSSKENIVRPTTELLPPAPYPNLPFQELKPLY